LGISTYSYCQPDYVFRNAVLESGTALQVGAVYRFTDVKPGIDALVTITDIEKISLNQLDGPSGFDEAFQPYIFCPAKTKGYIEFRFDFVIGGTNTPQIMTEVPVTAIDIDGYEFPDEKLYESDEFKTTASYYLDYDLLGSNLDINQSGGWVAAVNKSAITYDGIDTVQRDVMVSMVYSNVSSIMLRVGAENKSKNDMERLRSDYFKKFTYASSVLPKSALLKFNGISKSNSIGLTWELASNNELSRIVVEKGTVSNQLQPAGEFAVQDYTNIYQFTDASISGGTVFYRLKLYGKNGSVSYSNVLVFRMGATTESFKVYPTIINDNATLRIAAVKNEQTSLKVVDLGGRIMMQRTIVLQQGNNNISVNGLSALPKGTYVAMMYAGNETHTQKILVD